jgi:glycosyltransferase involved in cell wall biosynthesis
MKILYVHVIGSFGGASRSLYEVLKMASKQDVEPVFLTQRGSVVGFFSEFGPVESSVGLTQFDNTRYGHYRGGRWLVLLRELLYILPTVISVFRVKMRFRNVELIHLNEYTGLPVLLLLKLFHRCPIVVHVRSVNRVDESSFRCRLINHVLKRCADTIVAIDQNVANSLPEGLPISVIHNSLEMGQFALNASDEDLVKKSSDSEFKIGFVGNLIKVKGIYELIEAINVLVGRGISIKLVVTGDDPKEMSGLKKMCLRKLGLLQNSRDEILQYVASNKLESYVEFNGFSSDLESVYNEMDVLCFPSHYDAPGRPIFEAALYGKPSIAAISDPQSDTIINGITGISIAPKSALQIADAVQFLVDNPSQCKEMGLKAKQMALNNFNLEKNAGQLVALYKQLKKNWCISDVH